MTFPAGLDNKAPKVVNAGAELPICMIESLNTTLFAVYVFPLTYRSPPTIRFPATVTDCCVLLYESPESPLSEFDDI
jgi:hypothetical protein